jgi:hypothetical protein
LARVLIASTQRHVIKMMRSVFMFVFSCFIGTALY